jgi:hypothetical protein
MTPDVVGHLTTAVLNMMLFGVAIYFIFRKKKKR